MVELFVKIKTYLAWRKMKKTINRIGTRAFEEMLMRDNFHLTVLSNGVHKYEKGDAKFTISDSMITN